MRPLPQSLHDRAELLARSHPLGVVAELIGVQPSVLTRMRKRGWKAADYSSRVRPMPTDFAIQQHYMTFGKLQQHYGCGASTLKRWFSQVPARRESWKGNALRSENRGRR